MLNQPKEYNYCLRCGRKLKTKENRIRGYGAKCFELAKSCKKKSLLVKIDELR